MVDDTNGPMPESARDTPARSRPEFDAAEALQRLPTLQRNALRKIFDRHEFLPEEVVQLGYRRLQQAEGIGTKGLAAIADWLRAYGFELQPPPSSEAARPPVARKTRRSIEQAVRLLRTHGYDVVRQPGGGEPDASR